MHHHTSLQYLFVSFLKIGATAFGGFMALISAVENQYVDRNRKLDHKDMLDGISLASMLPGAVAVNVVAYVGYRLRGLPGVIVSVLAVSLPSFTLILILAWLYERWGSVPSVNNVFNGFLPAVCAVIVATAWNLGRKTVTGWKEGILFAVAMVALLWPGGFLVTLAVVVGSGLAGLVFFRNRQVAGNDTAPTPAQPISPPSTSLKSIVPLPLMLLVMPPMTGSLVSLLVVFGGMSLMLFGGGYVFIPLIQQIVVDGYHWVSRREFVDAIAMGQITPGPILISAAFIGYKVAGFAGSLVATVGIFAPSVGLMVLSTKVFTRLKESRLFQSALAGIRPAIIGLIAAAAIIIARSAPASAISIAIFAVALAMLIRFKLPVAAVILPAGVAGWILYQG